MGRLPTTNEDKIHKGTFRPYLSRETPHSGDPLSELPDPTLPMTDAAVLYYQSIGQSCINMQTLEPADLAELELCAYEFGVYWEYEDERIKVKRDIKASMKELAEFEEKELATGMPDMYLLRYKQSIVNEKNKQYKIILAQRNASFTSAVKMSTKFGVNPVDRQRLNVKPKRIENDPFADE